MTAFYVGQSVRVNCPGSTMHGDETKVIAVDIPINSIYSGTYIGIEVERSANSLPNRRRFVFEAHELEPLNPPKSQISEILAMKDLPNRDCNIARVGECV